MTTSFIRMGHRGAAAYSTENTLSSIQTALECGVDMVEMDVRSTKDGVLVLAHYPQIIGQGRRFTVRRSTYAQLQHLCLDGGEVPPTLEEALKFVRGKAWINLDIKEKGLERDIVALVKKLKMPNDQIMFSSLSRKSLRKIKTLNPKAYVTLSFPGSAVVNFSEWRMIHPVVRRLPQWQLALRPTQFVMRQILPFTIRRVSQEKINAIIVRSPFISPRLVDAAHSYEWKLYTWPVNAESEVAKLRQLGVDGKSLGSAL